MPRMCSVCSHPERAAIDLELLRHQASYRAIARAHGLEDDALRRHEASHLGPKVRAAKDATDLLDTQSLIAEMQNLHAHVRQQLDLAEASGNGRLALLAIREARCSVETLLRLGPLAQIDERLAALEHPEVDEGRA